MTIFLLLVIYALIVLIGFLLVEAYPSADDFPYRFLAWLAIVTVVVGALPVAAILAGTVLLYRAIKAQMAPAAREGDTGN